MSRVLHTLISCWKRRKFGLASLAHPNHFPGWRRRKHGLLAKPIGLHTLISGSAQKVGGGGSGGEGLCSC